MTGEVKGKKEEAGTTITSLTYNSEVAGEGKGGVRLEIHPATIRPLVPALHLLERQVGGGGVEGSAGTEQRAVDPVCRAISSGIVTVGEKEGGEYDGMCVWRGERG